MRALLLVSLLALPSCFLRDQSEFQSTWLADYSEPDGKHIRLRMDFSLIVEGEFTARALMRIKNPDSMGPGRIIEGSAYGTVQGNHMEVTVPVNLLTGGTGDLTLEGPRYGAEDNGFPVDITWRGTQVSTNLNRPLGNRWELDTGLQPPETFGTTTTTTKSSTTTTTTSSAGVGAARFTNNSRLHGNVPHDGTSPFTVEAWVASDVQPQFDTAGFVSVGSSAAAAPCEGFDLQVFNHAASIQTETVLVSGPDIIAGGVWHHVAAPWDGTTWSLYTDGDLVWSQVMCFGTAPNDTLRIGARRDNDQSFLGRIDEVRIWDTALAQPDIASNMTRTLNGSEAGLLGWWNLDDLSTGNALNGATTGSNYDLYIVGDVTAVEGH